jgi:type IV secretory pathway VirD2 relaxase
MPVAEDDFRPKLGRMRDGSRRRPDRLATQLLRSAGKAGLRAFKQKGHVLPGARKRGTGVGVRAAAGLIAPGSRRVIVKARYTPIVAGDLGAAQAHLRYIQRDGVTREGAPGHLYGARSDDLDPSVFLERSRDDPYQFRFIVAPEDAGRLADLKPFVRDLLTQMERDLDAKLDWMAVDHFNTGHPHTHIVIRGKDLAGEDLVMARDYIGHAIRARAQGLITRELGPESELERAQKLFNEVGQERFTLLDRALLARAKEGILTVTREAWDAPWRHTTRVGRLQTLERLGLAQEKHRGVWALDPNLETKLRQLGQRADKFQMMQRALKEAGIVRSAARMALFEKTPRKEPLVGKVVGVGFVDEITDRTWLVIDALDGRAHYIELGRLKPDAVPSRGLLVALGGGLLDGKPVATPRLRVLSTVELDQLAGYAGPTWLDELIIGRARVDLNMPGFALELSEKLDARRQWLAARGLAERSSADTIAPKPDMMSRLRAEERHRLAAELSRELKLAYVPIEDGRRHSGIYQRVVVTPTAKLAVISGEDTFTLAPWRRALEPMRGRAVVGLTRGGRILWSPDRGRELGRSR